MAALAFALGLHPSPTRPEPAPASQPLLLDVVVNGRPIGKWGEFQSRAGALFATRQELADLGFHPGRGGGPDELIAVASLPGVSERLDAANQTAIITAATKALRPQQLGPEAIDSSLQPIESGAGLVLNYQAAGTYAAGRSRVDALLDGRLFSPWGVASTQAILRAGAGATAAIRLDTTYTRSDPDTLQRLRVGDVISSGLAWTRPVRLGGAQFARDFALRPDLVTIPVPSIAGQVAVPSSVDVLINGSQVMSAQAEPGPFELRRYPVVNGVNDVALVVNDSLGQQVTTTVPFYTSTALLAPGLDAYSAELGAIRLGYGLVSNDYRAVAGSASYRRGVADWLTLSGHAEGSASLAMGGVGAAAALGTVAVASAALAGSTGRGRSGMLVYAALERVTQKLSLSVATQFTQGAFGDLATLYGDQVPQRAVRASAGYALGDAGTLGIAYTRQRRSPTVRPALFSPGLATSGGLFSADALTGPAFYLPYRTSLLTASYSVPVWGGRASFYATLFRDFDNRTSNGALFGVTLPLGPRESVSAGIGQSSGGLTGTLQANRAVVAVGDVGGQFYASEGGDRRVLATGQYKSPWSLLELSGYHAGGQTAWRGSATGALVLSGGDVFASNVIPDSFAIVDTDGTAGLDVSYENRLVDRTGASGRVLVPDLRSYEVNRISIDPGNLPLDVDVNAGVRLVRPADRSGVVVHFPVTRHRGALLRLVDDSGQPLPVGTRLYPEAGGPPVPVGYGGEAFLRDLAPHARLRAELPRQGSCVVIVEFQPVPGEIPTIGPLRCQ